MCQVDVRLVNKDEYWAVVGVLLLQVLVQVDEVVQCLEYIALRVEDEDEGRCVVENHGLVWGWVAGVVAGGEVV